MNTIILNYGCPRTGTTFVNQMLSQGAGFITGKIAEGHSYHPIRSKHGLLNLAYTFQKYNLIFIRTIRNPINIFESFYHAKQMKIEGLDGQEYSSIKKIIESEEANTKIQSIENIKIITLDFDKLISPQYSNEKILEISGHTPEQAKNTEIFSNFIENKYNNKPIRQGRLSDGARSISYLSEEEKKDIIKIDYAGNNP